MSEIKRYKCIVSYDGHNYNGFQSQSDGSGIQDYLQKALSKITNSDIKIVASGRTDSQVHAYGQVFHFDTDKTFKDLAFAINSQLPSDIYVVSTQEVNKDFHARYSVVYKHYDYLINNGQYNPLMANYCLYIKDKLDVEAMKDAAKIFIGTFDFTSFNATKFSECNDQIRTIYNISIQKTQDMITISFYGDGFLRYMVRMLTASLIEVGLGKKDKYDLINILEKKSKDATSLNCPGYGLYLIEVFY